MKNKDFSRSKHIPELDGLRGIAILMVMMAHFFNVDEAQLLIHYPFLGPFLTKISMFGTKGVELFFILSGYLITRILYIVQIRKIISNLFLSEEFCVFFRSIILFF